MVISKLKIRSNFHRFVLKDDILYWYSKELAPDSDFFKSTQENGRIELGIGCYVISTTFTYCC
jgi:hypothetical protein